MPREVAVSNCNIPVLLLQTNGIKPSAKKRKVKENLEDLVDHGEGYDLEDPFIDNTEAVSINKTVFLKLYIRYRKFNIYNIYILIRLLKYII